MTQTDDHEVEPERPEVELPVREVILAISDLPILARLEFARNLLESNGGNRDSLEPNTVLILVHDIIGDVIEVVRKRPQVAKLRTTEPKLG